MNKQKDITIYSCYSLCEMYEIKQICRKCKYVCKEAEMRVQ